MWLLLYLCVVPRPGKNEFCALNVCLNLSKPYTCCLYRSEDWVFVVVSDPPIAAGLLYHSATRILIIVVEKLCRRLDVN